MNVKELYDMSVRLGLSVLGKDGLPIGSLCAISSPKQSECGYYFLVCEDQEKTLDFDEFFRICVPTCAYDEPIQGEIEVIEGPNGKYIGVDLYTTVKTEDDYKTKMEKVVVIPNDNPPNETCFR